MVVDHITVPEEAPKELLHQETEDRHCGQVEVNGGLGRQRRAASAGGRRG